MDGGKTVAVNEGVRRIVKAISFLAWAWVALWTAIAVVVLFGTEQWLSLVLLGTGAIGFIVGQGLAWIIAGFSGDRGQDDGLIWARHIFKRKPQSLTSPVAPHLKGVSGWLAWVTFCFIFLAPAAMIGGIERNISASEADFPALASSAAWIGYSASARYLAWACAALSLCIGLLLIYRKQPSTITAAIATLWILGPMVSYIDIFALPTHYFGQDLLKEEGAIKQIITGLGSAIVWSLYFLRSRRVKNTYYS